MDDSDHSDIDANDQPSFEVIYPLNEKTEVPQTNGQLFKTVLVEGTGRRPPKGAKTSVHYVGTLDTNGSKFDSSRDRSDPFEFTIGQGQVIKGWDQGVATMRKGEKAILQCLPEYAYGANGSPPKIPGNSTLNFEVELLDWSKLEDVSEAKDRSLMKNTTVPSSSYDRAKFEAKVTIDVTIFLGGIEDGEEGARTELWRRNDWSFEIGGDDATPVGLETAVGSMGLGEEATVVVAAKLNVADDAAFKVPKGQTLSYDIKLSALTKAPETWKFNGIEKVEQATLRKDQGNVYFKAGKLDKAERKYKLGLEFVESDYGLDKAEDKQAAKIVKGTLYANLAQVLLNQKNYPEVISFTNKALLEDGSNLKALFRRAKAYNALSEWDDAKRDLTELLARDAGNVDAQRELQAMQEAVRAYDKKQQKTFGNMFQKLSKMEERDNSAQ